MRMTASAENVENVNDGTFKHLRALDIGDASHRYTGISCSRDASIPNVDDSTVDQTASADHLDNVDDSTFEELVVEASRTHPILVDWYADWCGPCKRVEPILKEMHATGAVHVVKAKPEDSTAGFRKWLTRHGQRFQIHVLPALILFSDGVPIKTRTGRFSKAQLEAFLGEHAGSGSGVVVPTATDKPDWSRVAAAMAETTRETTGPGQLLRAFDRGLPEQI